MTYNWAWVRQHVLGILRANFHYCSGCQRISGCHYSFTVHINIACDWSANIVPGSTNPVPNCCIKRFRSSGVNSAETEIVVVSSDESFWNLQWYLLDSLDSA